MYQFAVPILFSLLIWWFSTGIILYVIGLSRRSYPIGLAVAALLMAAALWYLTQIRNSSSVIDAYMAFACAIAVWGFVEMTFLTGIITGSRTTDCPPGSEGWQRARFATEAIIHHELALAAAGIVIALAAWDGTNFIAIGTFTVLWIMRLSSKFNLFLGVPTLNDELLPAHLAYLRSYFRRARMNFLFPFSILFSAAATWFLVASALSPNASAFEVTGYMLLASLLALALLEHVFMVLPVSIAKLWGLEPTLKAANTTTTDANEDNALKPTVLLATKPKGRLQPPIGDPAPAAASSGPNVKSI